MIFLTNIVVGFVFIAVAMLPLYFGLRRLNRRIAGPLLAWVGAAVLLAGMMVVLYGEQAHYLIGRNIASSLLVIGVLTLIVSFFAPKDPKP